MKNSNIAWTDSTWNIAVGCSKVDEDCKFCYMYRESLNGTRYDAKTVRQTKGVFNFPLKLKEPSKIFTSSLTDFFHEECDSFRNEAWEIIRKCPQHTFQILTKRPERIEEHLPSDWGNGWDNVILGTSIGSMASKQRVIDLFGVNAKKKFLSIEPLHGEINLREIMVTVLKMEFIVLPAFDWVIVGGESGNDNGQYKYRPCELSWIERIVKDCQNNQIPVFVKQLGTHLAKELKMSDRHGTIFEEFPITLQVREFPNL